MDAGGAGAEEEEDGREEASVRVKSPPRFLHGAAARQSRAEPGRAQGARKPRARLEIWGKTSSPGTSLSQLFPWESRRSGQRSDPGALLARAKI